MKKLKLIAIALVASILIAIVGLSLVMVPFLLFTESDQETRNIGIGYLFCFIVFVPASSVLVKRLIKLA